VAGWRVKARVYGAWVLSSLVNTLPITKKNKYTVVTEEHKECTDAAYAPANLREYGKITGPKPTPRARNDYDEETAYESYMNPEPGFQSGPGDSANAD